MPRIDVEQEQETYADNCGIRHRRFVCRSRSGRSFYLQVLDIGSSEYDETALE